MFSPPSNRAPNQDHLWDDDTEDDLPDFDEILDDDLIEDEVAAE